MEKRIWLIELRKEKELTQQNVADAAKISKSYYCDIERGFRNPSGPVALRLAEVLGCDMTRFFGSIRASQNKTA